MTQLTKNFALREFASKCGRPTPESVIPNLRLLATNLQVLRDDIGRPIRINSGYRSPEHNRAIGGASASQHVLGRGADIVVDGMTPAEVGARVEELIALGRMRAGGLKVYSGWVHYDVRGVNARW